VDDAVMMYCSLATDCPRVFKLNLTYSLGNLAKCLSHLGPQQEALEAEKEVVEMYQPLAADDPAKFNPNLAYSLNNLVKCLSHLGHKDDTLRRLHEAIKIRQGLAGDYSATFDCDLTIGVVKTKSWRPLIMLQPTLISVEHYFGKTNNLIRRMNRCRSYIC
jgi:tetratricopeptide (TPR) repeat protein